MAPRKNMRKGCCCRFVGAVPSFETVCSGTILSRGGGVLKFVSNIEMASGDHDMMGEKRGCVLLSEDVFGIVVYMLERLGMALTFVCVAMEDLTKESGELFS